MTKNEQPDLKVIPPEHREMLTKIGSRISYLRKKNTGESYEVFAIKNGINRISQYRIEKGRNFQMDTFLKIIDGLGVSLNHFFKGIK